MRNNNGAKRFQSTILKISKLKQVAADPMMKTMNRSSKVAKDQGTNYLKMQMRNPKAGSSLKDRIIISSLLELLLHKMRRTTMPQH